MKYRIIKILSLVLALFLIISTLQRYVFRHNNRDEMRMDGFRLEDRNSLDVLFLGSSEIYTGFSSAYAYKLHGFTSYPLSVSAGPVTLWKTMLTEALSRQTPQLIVVEINGVVYKKPEQLYNNAAMHYILDRMPLSVNKIQAVTTLLTDENDDPLSFFFPIMKYHSNWQNTDDLKAIFDNVWTQNRRGYALLRGVSSTPAIEKPKYAIRDLHEDFSESPLNEDAERYLREFLDFCVEKKLNVLFTRFPHVITENEEDLIYPGYQLTNTAERIITEYGFPFINLERMADEIGIDAQTDFYNANHLNIYGQRKVTEFFSDWLAENYTITPRQQSQAQREAWEKSAEFYELYCQYVEQQMKDNSTKAISETYGVIKKLNSMKSA